MTKLVETNKDEFIQKEQSNFAKQVGKETVADILVAVAYIGLILNNVIEVSKKWIIIGPISLYVIFGIL